MKYLLLGIISVFFTSFFCQKDFSNFFVQLDNLDTTQTFNGFQEEERGYYLISKEERRQMLVTLEDIQVRTGFEIVISKAEAQKKGFNFKDDKMYGLAPLDGVFYVEENDTIYALFYQNDNYFDLKNQIIIAGKNHDYFVFTHYQDNLYSVEHLIFSEDILSIQSIEHMEIMDQIKDATKTKRIKVQNLKSYIIAPTKEELNALVDSECFNDTRTFSKQEEL